MEMGHGGMDMSDGMGSCKISMLWNWYTIDACFLASSWHVRSHGMFAVSCIGVALLTVSLEALRQISREYDAMISRQWRAYAAAQSRLRARRMTASSSHSSRAASTPLGEGPTESSAESAIVPSTVTLRVTLVQQLIRAALHAATFGVAYIVMLLAMYFNGYIIISIILGAGLGKFACDWMAVTLPLSTAGGNGISCVGSGGGAAAAAATTDRGPSKYGAVDEPTVCCG